MVVTGYTVPRTLATQFRPCHLYGKRYTHVTRLTLRAPVPASCVDFAKCFVSSSQLQQPSISVNILSDLSDPAA